MRGEIKMMGVRLHYKDNHDELFYCDKVVINLILRTMAVFTNGSMYTQELNEVDMIELTQ